MELHQKPVFQQAHAESIPHNVDNAQIVGLTKWRPQLATQLATEMPTCQTCETGETCQTWPTIPPGPLQSHPSLPDECRLCQPQGGRHAPCGAHTAPVRCEGRRAVPARLYGAPWLLSPSGLAVSNRPPRPLPRASMLHPAHSNKTRPATQ